MRGSIRKGMGNEDPIQSQPTHSLYSLNENRKKRKKKTKINGEIGNLERTKDGTNKMRNMPKRLNKGGSNPKPPREAQLPLLKIRQK